MIEFRRLVLHHNRSAILYVIEQTAVESAQVVAHRIGAHADQDLVVFLRSPVARSFA